jgi:imidazolonepropionase-like amidohydrolase
MSENNKRLPACEVVQTCNDRLRGLSRRSKPRAWVLGALLSVAAPLSAQQPPPSTETYVIKAARFFDATTGTIKSNVSVVIQGDRIQSVGGGSPSNATLIDLGNATLMPGFIDAHTHIDDEFKSDYYKRFYTNTLRFPTEQAFYAEMYAHRTVEAGFTTVRNVGASDFVDVGLKNAINANIVVGPRILTAIHAIGSTGGHCDGPPIPPSRIHPNTVLEGVCSGPDSCREAVRTQMKYGADVIKICASGGVLSEADPVDVPQLTTAELNAIVSEAHAWKRKVAAHAHGDYAARLAVEAGVDSIEHGSFLSEQTLRLMKTKGTYLVPTRMAVFWVNKQSDIYPPQIAAKARAAYAAANNSFKLAVKMGVPIAFGTDAGVYPHGMNAQEFSLMTDGGMKPANALLAATRDAAKLLGIESEVGTLEAGKSADLVAVSGDVLQNIRATEKPIFVMARGKIVIRPK